MKQIIITVILCALIAASVFVFGDQITWGDDQRYWSSLATNFFMFGLLVYYWRENESLRKKLSEK